MIRLPLFTELTVSHYGLFPGAPNGANNLHWEFAPGLTLIAGVNGLGKTTLLMILLRSLTGPYDLTSTGAPERLEAVLPPHPVLLNSQSLRFFAQRVADGAENATAILKVRFAEDRLDIERRLDDLTLLSIRINDEQIDLPSRKFDKEIRFQEIIYSLFGLASFVDVLVVLHHIVFFHESRPGALWDENAQRQLLRALFLEKEAAARVSDFERKVQSADSRARNISARAFNIEKELEVAKRREALSPKVRAELEAEQKLLNADMERREELELHLNELDEARRAARLDHEKAKLVREEAEGAVERIKYTALSRLFPKMEDAARFVVLRILANAECLVCGADAVKRREELETMLAAGCCPACGAEPAKQAHVVPQHQVEERRIERERARADLARTEEETGRRRIAKLVEEYDSALNAITKVRKAIEDRQVREERLAAELPQASTTVLDLQRSLQTTRRSQREAEAERATASQELRLLLEAGQAVVISQAEQLSSSFGRHVKTLLAESAHLIRVETSARLTQGKSDFAVPAFRPEMSAANRPGLTLRTDPTDVSESQRELIDLAFRFALIDVATARGASSLVMETPEASLDGLAMKRVG